MARQRYQKGHIYLDGEKGREQWKGRYREDIITLQGTKRVRREVMLGSKSEMTKHLAERRMEVLLARINGFDYRPGRVATFAEFVREVENRSAPRNSNRPPSAS